MEAHLEMVSVMAAIVLGETIASLQSSARKADSEHGICFVDRYGIASCFS